MPAARLAGGPALADCVTELAGGPATPLAVDLATFDGQPAAVVLLPGIGGPGRVDVWVVPPDCAQAEGPVPVLRQRGAALTGACRGMSSP